MAYDEKLFLRIDEIAKDKKHIFKMKMFGGVGYLLKGNMCFGIYEDYLILRLGVDEALKALKRNNVKEFDITGRPMKGWVMVSVKGLRTKKTLQDWIGRAVSFASEMPAKLY